MTVRDLIPILESFKDLNPKIVFYFDIEDYSHLVKIQKVEFNSYVYSAIHNELTLSEQ